MTDYTQGDAIPLTAQFYEYSGGPGAILTGVTVTITRVGDSMPTLGPVSAGITNPANGLYAYTWDTTTSITAGSYTVVWDGTDASLDAVQASEVITLLEAVTGTWCSLADVTTITRATVTSDQLAAASAVISIYANRNPSSLPNLTERDTYWLKQACAWQARWQSQQPGYDQKSSIDSVNQDNTQVSYSKEWQISLAPLAARALKNLSWKASRSVRISNHLLPPRLDFVNEASDPWSDWEPLQGCE